MKIYYSTGNKGKIESINRDLDGLGIEVVMKDLEILEPQMHEVADIAKYKALKSFEELGEPCIAQDGGFYIPALNGFPKAYAKFITETIGMAGLLKLMEGEGNRECYFLDALAYMDKDLDEPIVFTSKTSGKIASAICGELNPWNWGPYHQIFMPEGHDRTYCEMSEEEIAATFGNNEEWGGPQLRKWLEENRIN